MSKRYDRDNPFCEIRLTFATKRSQCVFQQRSHLSTKLILYLTEHARYKRINVWTYHPCLHLHHHWRDQSTLTTNERNWCKRVNRAVCKTWKWRRKHMERRIAMAANSPSEGVSGLFWSSVTLLFFWLSSLFFFNSLCGELLCIAYFQAYSNCHGRVTKLRLGLYTPSGYAYGVSEIPSSLLYSGRQSEVLLLLFLAMKYSKMNGIWTPSIGVFKKRCM